VIGLVLLMNVVNFSDGVDGLAAACARSPRSRSRSSRSTWAQHGGVLAAIVPAPRSAS
jgi:hypothetical protein